MGQCSDNPENLQRHQNYRRYREQIGLQYDFLLGRYSAVNGIRRLQKLAGVTDEKIRTTLNELSPDTSRHEIIMSWLKSEMKYPVLTN
jgi:hypothetical protein